MFPASVETARKERVGRGLTPRLENAESIPGKKHSNTLALREAKPVETVKQVLNIGLFLSELVSR
jgi:hypothetical protein